MASADVGAAVRRIELDALRGVAVLAVVVAHGLAGGYPHNRGLGIATNGGVVGVQLFFALSGYLITGILLRGGGLGGFYARRARRLYPSLLVVSAAVLVWSGDTASVARAVTYTANIPAGNHGAEMMGHAWSLAVEEQFYLVWPILLLVARRHAAKVAVVGIALTWWAQSFAGWSEHAVYVGLRWDAILAGCLLALTGWRGGTRAFLIALVVLAVGLFADLGYPVLTVACAVTVASVPRRFDWRWLVHLGRISYPLYLWHVATLRLDMPSAVAIALGFALAEVTYRLVDRRAQVPRLAEPVRYEQRVGEHLGGGAARGGLRPVESAVA